MKQAKGATKPMWLVWAVTLGEAVLIGGAALVLRPYWLMLPIWMRSMAGTCLAIAAAVVIFRLFRFYRRRKRVVDFAKEETPTQVVS